MRSDSGRGDFVFGVVRIAWLFHGQLVSGGRAGNAGLKPGPYNSPGQVGGGELRPGFGRGVFVFGVVRIAWLFHGQLVSGGRA